MFADEFVGVSNSKECLQKLINVYMYLITEVNGNCKLMYVI